MGNFFHFLQPSRKQGQQLRMGGGGDVGGWRTEICKNEVVI